MNKILLMLAILFSGISTLCAQDAKLTGTIIGTIMSVDYNTNKPSTTVNTREWAFDGDVSTYFASYERSYAWVGLDLGEPHVISRVGWAPAKRHRGDERILLGMFEGANRPDFMDALPLYVITERGVYDQVSYADVTCSKGFRYVRYVGPADERCNIAEVEFYGQAGEGDETNLYRLTNLPMVIIHTENDVVPYDKVHQINAMITVVSDKDKELLCDSATVRLRGNGSVTFPKKPYRIKFNKKKRVLDAPAKAKKWTLINNYSDKTLMRNLLAFELSRCMGMPYTPYAQPVDVMLNGEYKGCYQLCDQIDVRKKRVNVDEMTPEDTTGVALTGGYLIEIDARASSEPSWFLSEMGNPVTIHYPDDDEITPQQHDYIQYFFNMMEENWKSYLDLETFLRHFLVGELSGNTDTYWSVYMYKYRDKDTLYTGPVWDFDLAFENDNRTYPINEKHDYVYRSGGSVTGKMRSFVDKICLQDEEARAKMLEIWQKARQGDVCEQHLFEFIDQQEEYLQEAQKMNFMRWQVMDSLVQKNPVAWGSYEAEVQNVRRFLRERLEWMDSKLGYVHIGDGIADAPVNQERRSETFSLAGLSCGSDLSALPKGVYIVRQGREIRKILKRD